MQRRYVSILVFLAVVLTVFSVGLSRRDSRDWRANRTRRLLPFPWQDTAGVTIRRADGGTEEFRKNDKGRWETRLEGDLYDALNPAAVEELTALATMTWREPQQNRLPPEPSVSVDMTVTSVGGQKVELEFGDVSHNIRAVCIDGDEETVYGVNQDLLGFLDWPRERFRDFGLMSVGSGVRPEKIVLSPKTSDPSLTIAVERKADGWLMTEPVAWPVDEARLDLLLRWIDRLRGEGIAAEMSADLDWFGFSPPSAFVEAWFPDTPGGKSRRVEFGKEEDGKVFVRESDRNPIFIMPAETLAEISMNVAADHPVQWRNFYRLRGMDLVGSGSPERVVIERLLPTPEKLTIVQTLEQGVSRWFATHEKDGASRTFPVEPPDGREPLRPLTALFTGLASLRVKTFLADAPPGPDTLQWTAYPAWRIVQQSVGGAESPALTIYAANPRGELPCGVPYITGATEPQEMTPMEGVPEKAGFAFSVGNRPAVLETFPELAYLLCTPPYRYQSRRLMQFEPRAFARVSLTVSGEEETYFRRPDDVNEQWWRDPAAPEPLMDGNNRFVAAMLELSQLRAEGFVADLGGDVAEFGLDRPEITAIVYSSSDAGADSSLFALAIGKVADDEGRRYARLNDGGPVFLVSAPLAESLGESYR